MKTRYPPLEPLTREPLTETDGDPRAAFAASLLKALKAPPALAPGVAARIELQLTRAPSPRLPEASWLARLAPKMALALGVLVAVSGSAVAAYRVPAVAWGVHRLVHEVAGWANEMDRRSLPSDDSLSAPAGTPELPGRQDLGAEEPAAPPAAPRAVAGPLAAAAIPSALVTSAASPARDVAPRKPRHRPPSPSVAASSGPATAAAASSSSQSSESAELERAFAEKRQGHLEVADSIFRSYRADHPSGSLATEAALGQLDVEMALGRLGDALGLLDLLCDDRSAPRWNELRLLRAELLSQTGQCAQALPTFGESFDSPALAERALYGRAICQQRLGRLDESRRSFRAFLERHPNGPLAAQAQRALGLSQ